MMSTWNSFPEDMDKFTRKYANFKVLVTEETEGGGAINKLVIGTNFTTSW